MALDTNLVAYWKMEDATDALGTYNGTASNVTFSSGNGKVNNGGGFNGSSSSVSISNNSALTPSAISVSFWVNFTSTPSSGNTVAMIDKRDNSGGTAGWGVQLYNASGTLQIQFFGNTNSNTPASFNWTPSTSTWYHIVFTKPTGTTASTLYINGSSQGTAGSQSFSNYAKSLYFGNRDASGSWLNGKLDEIGLWSREITGAEVTSLYNSGSGTTYPFGTAYSITAAKGTFTLTGIATLFNKSLTMAAAQGSYVLTGIAAAFARGKGFVAETGAFILTGNDTLFSKVITMIAGTGTYVLTGVSTVIQKGISMAVSTGEYVTTFFNVRLPLYWNNITKNSSSWTNSDKNSSSWSNEDKTNI